MKNAIILGSGRSGTSMVAGVLSPCGYYMGERLYAPRESNPKGFFESPDINLINEAILADVLPSRPAIIGRWFYRDRPAHRQRWLARVPLDAEIASPPGIESRIAPLVARAPYCFKDPRFCYTLPVWRPFLQDVVLICVFRHPAATAASIVKECASARYLRNLSMNFPVALEVWSLMYRHVLSHHSHEGEWVFVHYNQMLNGEGVTRIEKHLHVQGDRTFPDQKLRRSPSAISIPQSMAKLYAELCERAGYQDSSDEQS